jgi:hypothetical protein
MLVTIAALPLANEEEKSGSNSNSTGSGLHHGAIRPMQPAVNPMAALGLG